MKRPPSIHFSASRSTKQTNEWNKEKDGLKQRGHWTVFFFREWDSKMNFYTNKDKKKKKSNNKNSNKKSVSNSNHTHQEFPWGAGGCGDCPCVIHILTSVFQCEGRIIHVCCGQLSPIWNQWNTNGFWTGIMILYVYKKQKNKKGKKNINTKSLDICCTLNGLFILNFVSIGLLY